jgi:hypothetical protein
MKPVIVTLSLMFISLFSICQTCEEYIEFVKSESYGTTYSSYDSEAISEVTFYDVMIDYQTYYFAIVCFKREYSYSCSEYIYQVASNTQINYSTNYLNSAGKAFWNYIHPYNNNLGCAPNF